LLVSSGAVPPLSVRDRIKLELLNLYRDSYALRGEDSARCDSIRDHCLRRLDEYTAAMARDPEKWNLWLANEATKNCFGVEQHIGAAIDMMIAIDSIMSILRDVVIGSIMQRESIRQG